MHLLFSSAPCRIQRMTGLFWQHLVPCLLFFVLHFQVIFASSFNSTKLCSPEESFELLHFKNSISSADPNYRPFESWDVSNDCCSWEGVSCDMLTGHVIGLDLTACSLSGTIDSNSSLFMLHHLQTLDLSNNSFSGSLPTSLWNLTRITYLDLRYNNFSGQISAMLSNLGQLTYLGLNGNKFSGELPNVFGNLSKLNVLSADGNYFRGCLPSTLFNHVQLPVIALSDNQFEGPIPGQVDGISKLTNVNRSFEFLDLSINKLTGPVPNYIFEHVNLAILDLFSNELSGILKSHMLSKLKNLISVDCSYNYRLSLINDDVNFSLSNLEHFHFSSCNLTAFPIFLRNSRDLRTLGLSNNSLTGAVSDRAFKNCWNLRSLDLSNNFLTSFENISLLGTTLQILNLESNLLEGPLTVPQTNMTYFSVSNNKLVGQLPQSFCDLRFQHLDFSYNNLTGTIPQCLGMLSGFLDLRANYFHGSIPPFQYCRIHYLNLNGNQLDGKLSPSLASCSALEVLDVGNNMINDTFPHWLGSLFNLKVVVLKSNRFHGLIKDPTTNFSFTNIRILDLSHNFFTWVLPIKYFENFKAMIHGDTNSSEDDYMAKIYPVNILRDGRYMSFSGSGRSTQSKEYYSITLIVKGINLKMERILSILTVMDLSNNQFQGPIPKIVGKFNSIELLNLSNNNLIGHIPSLLENLTKLESLDLSSNMLVGEIPTQLASLTSLEVLNLSHNHLVGAIPKGPQFNTFSNDSFVGNWGLCGFPLSKKCNNHRAKGSAPTILQKEDDNPSWFDWKIVLMGYGSGLVIGLSMGYMTFALRKPQWLIRIVEKEASTKVGRRRRRR